MVVQTETYRMVMVIPTETYGMVMVVPTETYLMVMVIPTKAYETVIASNGLPAFPPMGGVSFISRSRGRLYVGLGLKSTY